MIKRIVVADVDSSFDSVTGDRSFSIVSAKVLALDVDFTGMQTKQLGQAQNIVLVYSVVIPRIQYHNEKYCYFDGNVYEVKSLSKAKLPSEMTLNLSKLEDDQILEAFETWEG